MTGHRASLPSLPAAEDGAGALPWSAAEPGVWAGGLEQPAAPGAHGVAGPPSWWECDDVVAGCKSTPVLEPAALSPSPRQGHCWI